MIAKDFNKKLSEAIERLNRLPKPCPFCHSTDIDLFDAGNKTDIWFIQCQNCWATFPHFDSEHEAIAAWNRRAEDT